LNVITGPQDVVAGQTFASDLEVEYLDYYGNRVTWLGQSAILEARLINSTNTTRITTSGPYGAVNGLVTFTGLTFNSAGQRHLNFGNHSTSTVQNISARSTSRFTISPAAAASISFTATPQSITTNDTPLAAVGASYPALLVTDVYGNTVDNALITISASVDPTPQSLTGNTVTTNNGAATFNALRMRAGAGDYEIEFAAESVNGVFATLSHTVTVGAGVATQLAITQQSSVARAGQNLVDQPIIEIRDSAGNRVTNSTLEVAISIEGATLAGQTTVSAVAGTASFTSVVVSGSASDEVTLSYSIEYLGQTISTSASLQLLAGDAASASLSWAVTDVQTRVAPQNTPVVSLFDEFGNPVLSDSSSTLTASLYRAGALVAESSSVFTASSGEITVNSLALRATPQAGYYYHFEVAGLTPVTSSEFAILPGPVAKVYIQQQPGSGTAPNLTRTGNALSVQPIIHLLDQDDNLVTWVFGQRIGFSFRRNCNVQ
jgi:hypothetical protein